METNYHNKISTYYDNDACNYEEKQCNNLTINKIRADFRTKVSQYQMPKTVLEIGIGVGMDIAYFAEKHPESQFYGIDISPKMIALAKQRVEDMQLKNIHIYETSVENMEELLTGTKFDLIYVFFGALNTVPDLKSAVNTMNKVLNEEGKIVATFVNKWYFYEFFISFIKLKFSISFRRLQKTWKGYSLKYEIPSKLYFPKEITKTFKNFKILYKQGYSITHPAWFQDHNTRKLGSLAQKLWNFDKFLSKTPFWAWGEYVLFIFEKK